MSCSSILTPTHSAQLGLGISLLLQSNTLQLKRSCVNSLRIVREYRRTPKAVHIAISPLCHQSRHDIALFHCCSDSQEWLDHFRARKVDWVDTSQCKDLRLNSRKDFLACFIYLLLELVEALKKQGAHSSCSRRHANHQVRYNPVFTFPFLGLLFILLVGNQHCRKNGCNRSDRLHPARTVAIEHAKVHKHTDQQPKRWDDHHHDPYPPHRKKPQVAGDQLTLAHLKFLIQMHRRRLPTSASLVHGGVV